MKPFAPSKQQRVIPIILAFLLLGQYAMAFGIALTLGKAVAAKDIGSFVITGGLVFWYLWKCLERRGWIGALVGVAVSFVVLVLCSALAGNVRGERTDILDQVPQFAALKRNFPEVAEQVRKEMLALSTDTTENRQKLVAMIQARVAPVVSAAMKTTSDAAIVQYANAKIRQFQEVADSNSSDCVSLMSGQLAQAPPATLARVRASISKETTKAMQDSFAKVLNDADAYRNSPPASDDKRFNALYEQLDVRLKSAYGTSAYYFGDDSLNKPADVRCRAGLLLFKEVLNLPEKDRLFMLRTLFVGD